MPAENFVIRDSVEYVYRESRYGRRSFISHIGRKLAALKLYFFLIVMCAGVGAAVTFLSDYKPSIPSFAESLDPVRQFQQMSGDQKQQILRRLGADDMANADLMEKFKQFQKMTGK